MAPADVEPLRRAGFQLFEPPTFGVAFLALNQAMPPLDNPSIRQAVAHSLDREAVVKAFYSPSAMVAHQFIPPTLWGYAPDAPRYPLRPRPGPPPRRRVRCDRSRSGVLGPTRAPTGPGFPTPNAIALAIAADLEKVGFTVVRKPATDAAINQAVSRGQAQLYLGQDDGLRTDPDAFLSRFQRPSASWGFDDSRLFGLLDPGRGGPRPG